MSHPQAMRKCPTKSEARVWLWLRNRAFSGYKFRRQHPVGRYILDFYCPEIRLAIEVDGTQHESLWMNDYDSQRTAFLRARGIEVIRIPNEVVARDPRMAAEMILWGISQRKS